MVDLRKANRENINKILAKCDELSVDGVAHRAYILATAYHETAFTFQPVREAYWLKDPDKYLKQEHPEYYPYYGRGFAQLTWAKNYQKYEKLLNIPLSHNPDLALDPDVAAFVLVHGVSTGGFTGKKLSNYINNSKIDFVEARRTVNGLDKAGEIATYAIWFLDFVYSNK